MYYNVFILIGWLLFILIISNIVAREAESDGTSIVNLKTGYNFGCSLAFNLVNDSFKFSTCFEYYSWK